MSRYRILPVQAENHSFSNGFDTFALFLRVRPGSPMPRSNA